MNLNWHIATFADLSAKELYAVLRLRQQVFVVEQHCVYLDCDGLDQRALHMMGSDNGALLAYQRCLPPQADCPESSIGRIVVDTAARGRQLGRELVRRGIAHNLQRWPGRDICINAQSHLQGFYGSLGFTGEGDEYLEDGIPHRKMRLRADPAS